MKDEILKIIDRHLDCHDDIGIDNTTSVIHEDAILAADELTALMCYREARAVIDWIGIKYLEPEYEDVLVMQLKDSYPTEMIWEAIEKYKNEQK